MFRRPIRGDEVRNKRWFALKPMMSRHVQIFKHGSERATAILPLRLGGIFGVVIATSRQGPMHA